MFLNTRRMTVATSYKNHLAIALRILDVDFTIALLFLDVDLAASLDTYVRNLWPYLIDGGCLFTDEGIVIDYVALF